MKIGPQGAFVAYDSRAAFTIVELMISLSIFSMVIGGVLYAHITGLKMFQISQAKVGASDESRMALAYIINDIRGAQRVAVGNGSASTFAEVGDGTNQQGGAIQVYRPNWDSSTNTNAFVRYYLNTSEKRLYRKEGSAGGSDLVAKNLTNTMVFSALTYTNTVLQNNDNNQIIQVLMQFYQIQYPIVTIGTNQYYDYFQLSAKIARRSI